MNERPMTEESGQIKENARRIFGPLSCVLYLLLFCQCVFGEELRFKFQPGDKYLLTMTDEQRISRIMDGNERTMEQTTRLECELDVKEVDENGTAWVKYTYKRFFLRLKSSEQKVEYDSDSNQYKVPVQAMPMRMAIGESLYLLVTPYGRIDTINGLSALVTYAKGRIGNSPDAAKVSRDIERQFNEPDVRRAIEDQLAVFPDSNTEGAVWSRVEVLSAEDVGSPRLERVEDINVISEKTFRLHPEKSENGGIAVVDVNLVFRPAPAAVVSNQVSEEEPQDLIKTVREISGTGAGQIQIEEATGRIINYTMTQDVTEKLKFVSKGSILRPPPEPQPLFSHIFSSFQMTKVEGAKPAQPADANEEPKNGS